MVVMRVVSGFSRHRFEVPKARLSLFRMTRAAPAKLLGLADRGHLGAGAIADVAVYRRDKDIAKMLGRAALVFKNGDPVVKDGEITGYRWGRALRLNPPPDRAIVRRLEDYHERRYGLSLDWFNFPDSAIAREEPFREVPCRA